MISVEELLRPASPSRGPPFVPSKTTRVGLFTWPKAKRGIKAQEAAAVAAARNCRREVFMFRSQRKRVICGARLITLKEIV